MDIKKLQRAIVDGLEDVKAQHISVFNTEHLSAMFERVIIATGASNRQTKSLAASVRDTVRKREMQVLSVEGEDNGEWIIVDCGAAVVHIMQPAIREYYHLEEIWGGKNVRVKIGAVSNKLVKASEPDVVVAPKKTAAKKASTKKVVAKKAANKSAAYNRVAGKSPARKTAAKTATKSAPAGKTVIKKTTARKTTRPG
jgi:ribosome-associated protein